MWKKILVGFFVGASLLAISPIGYAANTTDTTKIEQKVDISKYQVTLPEKLAYSTEDKVTFIHGIAPAGTSIIIEVYGTTDLTRKNFNLLKLPADDDYIEIFTDTIKSGNMGFFDKQLDLVTGINKIIIKFEAEGIAPIEIIVFVKTPENTNIPKDIKFTEKLIDILMVPK